MEQDQVIKSFDFSTLPIGLRGVAGMFYDAACKILATIDSSPERDLAISKLIEAKDAAILAKTKTDLS